MLKIALTGPTGSGKGYVCALARGMDVPSLDTDRTVHELYADKRFASALESALCVPLRARDGTVDRKKLAMIVFSDQKKMETLLSLVYPRVRQRIASFLRDEEKKGKRAAIVDAPQLYEAGFEGDFDRILCVFAPKETRVRRIIARDGITRGQALCRMAHQKSGREYMRLADATVRNGEGDDVKAQLEEIFAQWGIG